ncbi:MAG TPA: HEAT repeat domain-containing protein [Opitutaceae bacterium]|nr:HEAT repeat domain-containing protein [Opitutaceae bacterium]
MNCQSCTERMAELSDARLDETTAASMREHLDGCPDCRREYDSLRRTLEALDSLPAASPSHRLRARVAGDIETEKLTLRRHAGWASSIRAAAGTRPDRGFRWAPTILQALAACALIALGFAAGERTATQRQLVDLRARVDTMGQLFEQSVLQKRATGDRLETILTAATARKPDERVIDGLINSMAFDTSVNVRLNALNALYQHADQDVVRAAVLACLPREANPLVQVAMIDFLVAARHRDAAPELRKLISDDKADADVRESARRAIEQL